MMEQKVSEIMTRDVITTTPETDVVYAFEKLMQYKISSLPVVDGEKLIGIITATDVGHNLILDKYELGTKVEEIMVKDVVTISPDDTLKTAIDESEPEIVFHLAAQPIVRTGYQNPLYNSENGSYCQEFRCYGIHIPQRLRQCY